VIPIRRHIVMLMSAAFMTFGLTAFATPQQEVCIDLYVEVDGAPVVDEGVCLPPPA
jgi:hypothetical protein